MRFHFGRYYNEFKSHTRWHDYINVSLLEFPLICIRRYDWMDDETSTWTFGMLGITINFSPSYQ